MYAAMQSDLINGVYRVLGDLPTAPRPNMRLAHSLVTGELVTLAVPSKDGQAPTAAQLRLEGEIFGELAHPNVHRIVDWGAEEVFVAWEYQPLWTLGSILEEGRPAPLPAVLRLLHDVVMGLSAIHSRGAVYRGLHPGRVLIARDGSAKLATCPDVVNTGRGRAVGIGPSPETPIRYLPPEQIDGSFDGRADLYTAAAVAWELVTGRRLYGHADPVTLAVQILKTCPEPPSQYCREASPEIDDFLLHCLARDPSDRPATAMAFLAHVRKIGESIGLQTGALLAEEVLHGPVAFAMAHRAAVAADSPPADAPAGGFAGLALGTDESPEPGPAHFDEPGPVAEHHLNGAARNGHRAGHSNGHNERAPLDAPDAGVRDATRIALLTPDGRPLQVSGDRLVIGRGAALAGSGGLDLSAFDDSRVVSRNHAELTHTTAGWVCRDLGATNGTYVNGKRLPSGSEVPLAPGDRISFANVALLVEGMKAWATS
jgi:hypothetical protein